MKRPSLSFLLLVVPFVACGKGEPKATARNPPADSSTLVVGSAAPLGSPSLSSASAPKVPAALPKDAEVVVPGRDLGALGLWMSRGDLDKSGLTVAETTIPGRLTVGPYVVVVDERGVSQIEVGLAKLPNGIVVGGTHVPSNATYAALRAALPGCREVEMMEGGKVSRCSGGLSATAAGPLDLVEVRLVR